MTWRVFFIGMFASAVGCASLLGVDGEYVLGEDAGGPGSSSGSGPDGSNTTDGGGNNGQDGSGSTEGGGGGDAGGEDARPDVVLPPICTPAPSTSAEAIDDTCAIFASPNGIDSNAGTKAAPVRTIKQGIVRSLTTGKRLYVCNAFYDEVVDLRAPVDIFGGFICPAGAVDGGSFPTGVAWSYAALSSPIVAPTTGSAALVIKQLSGPARIEDMTFFGRDTAAGRVSSVAAFISDSPNVQFTRARFVARAGLAGATIGGPAAAPLPAPTPGNNISGIAAGAEVRCDCQTGGFTVGGRGGGSAPCGAGAPGLPSYSPSVPPSATGAGGGTCGNGFNGSSGPNGINGAGGVYGSITGETWVPANGAPGTAGSPGQGGGGSGCAAGGSGGCGGCGGGGGPAGAGGGSSIGLLVRDARVELITSVIEAGNGGAGGAGGGGVAGAIGADGGTGNYSCPGPTRGGKGGTGGTGGAGGGGSGGFSACVLYVGGDAGVPQLDPATRAACTHGTAGPAGTSAVSPGSGGIADVIVQLP